MHATSHLSRLASLLEALATEITEVFSEPQSLGFPKVGWGGPSACLESPPSNIQLKVLLNHFAA